MVDFLPVHISSRLRDGNLLRIWQPVRIASAHNSTGAPAASSIGHAISNSDLQHHLTEVRMQSWIYLQSLGIWCILSSLSDIQCRGPYVVPWSYDHSGVQLMLYKLWKLSTNFAGQDHHLAIARVVISEGDDNFATLSLIRINQNIPIRRVYRDVCQPI